jgi:hypothetical protein
MGVFVQANLPANIAGPTNAPSAAYTSPNTAGNTLVVGISWDSIAGTTVTSMTGNGNIYVQRGPVVTIGTRQMALFTVANCAAGANTVIANMAANVSNVGFSFSEYSGLGAFDIVAHSASVATILVPGQVNFTPSAPGETVVVHGWCGTFFTTADTNYISRAVGSGRGVEDRLVAPAGAQSAQFGVDIICCCCEPAVPYILFAVAFAQAPPAAARDALFFNQT